MDKWPRMGTPSVEGEMEPSHLTSSEINCFPSLGQGPKDGHKTLQKMTVSRKEKHNYGLSRERPHQQFSVHPN